MAESTINEQIQEYLNRTKNLLTSMLTEIDKWFDCLQRIAKLLKSDIPLQDYRDFVNKIKRYIQDLYDDIVAYGQQFDEALGKTWIAKLMDLENLWGELVIQTGYVDKSIKNVAEGCLPDFTKINLPKSWRDAKTTMGRGSNVF